MIDDITFCNMTIQRTPFLGKTKLNALLSLSRSPPPGEKASRVALDTLKEATEAPCSTVPFLTVETVHVDL
jgi:hypothetical protein